MLSLYAPVRHEPLAVAEWNPQRVRYAIAAICRDAESAFHAERLWPMHPEDDEPGTPADAIFRGVYCGAAGMLHALDRLAMAGFYEPSLDLAAIAGGLYEAALASPDEEGAGPSLMIGASGILLVAHRLAPSRVTAQALADVIAENVAHPANELLYGAPGTMLAARAMHARTGEERFAELWRASARELLARQGKDGLWTQDLFGRRNRFIGAAHGFAGNVLALHAAPEWLDDARSVETRAVATARALAIVDGDLSSWPVVAGGSRTGPPPRVQWCHGAAGIVTSLARLAPDDDAHGALMAAGGELVWTAGPVAGNAGLCHGTGGNGFAFLALWDRTGDERWLERARAFATHSLDQVDRLRAATGRGRYWLFTGDIGAALLAAACLTGDARLPGLDDL
ncbi:lanthionine synthetase C family protein [Verrucomicrobiota bacterium sgz303538]